MILSFTHKGLSDFFSLNSRKGIPASHTNRIERILDRLDTAHLPEDMDIPGYRFHALKGARKNVYSVWVNANWRITFEFVGHDVCRVNLEDYH